MNSAPTQRLDHKQIGHLRHIENISSQLAGDWAHMGGRRPGQEDFGAFRFQIAFMAYTLALTHRHRLPNAPGYFKRTFDRLIQKMLHPDVWMYWRNVSRGGAPFNAQLTSSLHEEWNPVIKDNIMYSAYLHSMALLYNYLFDDDKYAAPASLTFRYISPFWHPREERFEYDQKLLNDHLYWQMVESGYLGIACEPNCVFQICNQPAILGFRMHDLLYGGDIAGEVTRGFQRAWSEFGTLDANGHYNMMVLQDSRAVLPNAHRAAWVDGWCGTLMNMWNRDFVHAHYSRQISELLSRGPDGEVSVNTSPPMALYGSVLDDVDCGDFGFAASWSSEMGDTGTTEALLAHSDRFMHPTWEQGGLYYPRNDQRADERGRSTLVEPIVGNALLGYARLNVCDGMWTLFSEPWQPDHFSQPLITDISSNADVLRAVYDSATAHLHFTLSPRRDCTGDTTIRVTNSGADGEWKLLRDRVPLIEGEHAKTMQMRNEISLTFQLNEAADFELERVLEARKI